MSVTASNTDLEGFRKTSSLVLSIQGQWSALDFSRFFFDLNSLHEGVLLYELQSRRVEKRFHLNARVRRGRGRTSEDILLLYGQDGLGIPQVQITSINFNSPGKIIASGLDFVLKAIGPSLAKAVEGQLSPEDQQLRLEEKRAQIDRIYLENQKLGLENMQTALTIAIDLKRQLGASGPIEDEIDLSHATSLNNHPLLGPALGLSDAIATGRITSVTRAPE